MAGSDENLNACFSGNRKFYDIPEAYVRPLGAWHRNVDYKAVVENIETNCVGNDVTFTGPFGNRQGEGDTLSKLEFF